jgi:hypothetical protein
VSELRDLAGAIHVHSRYSDSQARIGYIIECARKAGLDYLVMTDHNDIRALHDGWQGWHDDLLLIIGCEVTSTSGHAVVLGIDEAFDWKFSDPETYLPQVRSMGGDAFIAHPERSDRGKLYRSRSSWPKLKTDAYAGVEIWSYAHDFMDWALPWRVISALRNPDHAIAGPHPNILRAWDGEARRRHSVGIGALDAHEYRFPIPYVRWSPLKVMSTEYLFRTVRTHALVPSVTGEARADVAAIRAALVGGQCYTSYDLIGDARGMSFAARSEDGRTIQMGEEVVRHGEERRELEFVAHVPLESEIRLIRDGEAIVRERGTELVHRDKRAGVYRIEVRLGGRPWVFTNHVYVRDAADPAAKG